MDLITFDLDETIITSRKGHWKAFNDAFELLGLKRLKFKELEIRLNGKHAHGIVKDIYPELSDKDIDFIVKKHNNFLGKKYGRYAKRIPGVLNSLKKIKKKYKIGIVTNCTHFQINGLLKGAKINKKLFDAIIGKDDVKHSKPCPDEIFKAEKLTGMDVAYHVGDSIYDVIAGKKANAKSIAVLTGVTSKAKLAKEKPFKIFKSVNELPKFLKV